MSISTAIHVLFFKIRDSIEDILIRTFLILAMELQIFRTVLYVSQILNFFLHTGMLSNYHFGTYVIANNFRDSIHDVVLALKQLRSILHKKAKTNMDVVF